MMQAQNLSAEETTRLMTELAIVHGVKLYLITDENDPQAKAVGQDAFCARSWYSGRHIWIGLYEDQERRLLSFFHELGHITDPKEVGGEYATLHAREEGAWAHAYLLAAQHSVVFSKSARAWAQAQLKTYEGYEERELAASRRWQELDRIKEAQRRELDAVEDAVYEALEKHETITVSLVLDYWDWNDGRMRRLSAKERVRRYIHEAEARGELARIDAPAAGPHRWACPSNTSRAQSA